LTNEEMAELDLAGESQRCAAIGIQFVFFPIHDRAVSDSAGEVGGPEGKMAKNPPREQEGEARHDTDNAQGETPEAPVVPNRCRSLDRGARGRSERRRPYRLVLGNPGLAGLAISEGFCGGASLRGSDGEPRAFSQAWVWRRSLSRRERLVRRKVGIDGIPG